jgi:hypothetical protein
MVASPTGRDGGTALGITLARKLRALLSPEDV